MSFSFFYANTSACSRASSWESCLKSYRNVQQSNCRLQDLLRLPSGPLESLDQGPRCHMLYPSSYLGTPGDFRCSPIVVRLKSLRIMFQRATLGSDLFTKAATIQGHKTYDPDNCSKSACASVESLALPFHNGNLYKLCRCANHHTRMALAPAFSS